MTEEVKSQKISPIILNREIGLLQFQARVLAEAQNEKYPLLERVKFLAYVYHNLDEFFMVRVGGLHMQNAAGVTKLSSDGKTPAEQLAQIRKDSQKLYAEAEKCWTKELLPLLEEEGIKIFDYKDLSQRHRNNVDKYFLESIFPTLTPLAFDPGHPFPHISNLSLNLAVLVNSPSGEQHFARIKVPASIPRFLPIKKSSGGTRKDGTVAHDHYFVWVEQVIANNLPCLFPGMEIIEAHPFRIIRNTDLVIQELEAGDLLETMEESVRKRRFGVVVQLAVSKGMPDHMLSILTSNLNVHGNDVFKFSGPLGLSQIMDISKINRFDLKSKQFLPRLPQRLQNEEKTEDIFSAIRQKEILLHHPYDSFDPVIKFIETAATDPNVLAIKQTLYRTGSNSPIVNALLSARRDHNKQVAVLVELKARFDEVSNISWARKLEQEGVHVTYGLLGLKTHSKIALVIRKDEDGVLRRYIHLGTGNYNAITARSYEDFSFMTCDEDIGADASDLFNYLTGYSAVTSFKKLLVAPITLRQNIENFIIQEIDNQKSGKKGRIILKTNAIVDKKIIKLLYEASQAGVEIDLIVRGICCLLPGVEGLSENIKVTSVVGRFLEHSRIYYFYNQGDPQIYMGSADMMPRNLDNRVEVLFPIENPSIVDHIYENVLTPYLKEDTRSWLLNSENEYVWNNGNQEETVDIQNWFITHHNDV